VQVSSGYDAKPETCQLFPFNWLAVLGDILVVRPHYFLCPLTLTTPGHPNSSSNHQSLTSSLVRNGVKAFVPALQSVQLGTEDSISLEIACRTLAANHALDASYAPLAAAQVTATLPYVAADGLALDSVHGISARVHRLERTMRTLLGVPLASSVGTDVQMLMAAVTPTLRSLLVWQMLPAVTGARRLHVSVERIPLLLMALSILLEAAKASGMAPTYQTAMKLFEQSYDLLYLLALGDDRVAFDEAEPLNLRIRATEDMRDYAVSVIFQILKFGKTRSLSEILQSVLPSQSPERQQSLRFLSRQFANCICPLGQRRRTGGLVLVRRRLSRRLMAVVGPDVIRLASHRLSVSRLAPQDMRIKAQ
jgi:hypothetical protein